MQIDKFAWDAPLDDPLWSLSMHWDLKTTLQPTAAQVHPGVHHARILALCAPQVGQLRRAHCSGETLR